jgi:hypothetical protein
VSLAIQKNFAEAQRFDWMGLRQLLGRVLPGHASLKAVKILFQRDLEEDDVVDYGCPLEGFASLLVELWDRLQEINLVHFSVLFKDTGTKERIVSSSFQDYWDKNMVPILALNWYQSERNQRTKQAQQRPKRHRLLFGRTPHLALRVLDVNRGNIYHLVTASAPSCDMAPTNSTLIYQLLRETDIFKTR